MREISDGQNATSALQQCYIEGGAPRLTPPPILLLNHGARERIPEPDFVPREDSFVLISMILLHQSRNVPRPMDS